MVAENIIEKGLVVSKGLGATKGLLFMNPVEKTGEYIIGVLKFLTLKSCGFIQALCIVGFGVFALWFIIYNKSNIAKEGCAGSVIIYIGTKLIEVLVK